MEIERMLLCISGHANVFCVILFRHIVWCSEIKSGVKQQVTSLQNHRHVWTDCSFLTGSCMIHMGSCSMKINSVWLSISAASLSQGLSTPKNMWSPSHHSLDYHCARYLCAASETPGWHLRKTRSPLKLSGSCDGPEHRTLQPPLQF